MSSEEEINDLPGVGPATAEKLINAGYQTLEKIAVSSPEDLAVDTEIGVPTAKKIVANAKLGANIGGFTSGKAILEKRKEVIKIPIHVEEIDEMLGGGFETQSISEIYGKFGSGKTQVVHQMVVNTVLPEEYGGQGCSVLYIDTERTFRPERFKEMITGSKHIHGYEFDEDELADQLLDNIHVAQAFNSSHQMLLIEKLGTICEELKTAGKPVRLIVVDSLAAHFRSEFIGRGKLNERQQKLNKMMHDLSECAMLYNAVALVTNQVQDNPGQLFGDPIKPIGGNVVGHTSAFRIYIRKSKGDKRVLKLVDSPNLPDSEAIAAITMDGVVDD